MKTAEERFFDYCMRRCTCNGCHYERYCFPELNKKGETNEFKDERKGGGKIASEPTERKRI